MLIEHLPGFPTADILARFFRADRIGPSPLDHAAEPPRGDFTTENANQLMRMEPAIRRMYGHVGALLERGAQ
jgi:hypothetical protein